MVSGSPGTLRMKDEESILAETLSNHMRFSLSEDGLSRRAGIQSAQEILWRLTLCFGLGFRQIGFAGIFFCTRRGGLWHIYFFHRIVVKNIADNS